MSIITNRSRPIRPLLPLPLERRSPISSFVRPRQSLNCYKNIYYSVRVVTRRRRTSPTIFNGSIRKRRKTGDLRSRFPSRFVLFCKYIYIDIFFLRLCVLVEKSKEKRDVHCVCTVVIVCFAQVFGKDSDTHCCVLSVYLSVCCFSPYQSEQLAVPLFLKKLKLKIVRLKTSYVRFCF